MPTDARWFAPLLDWPISDLDVLDGVVRRATKLPPTVFALEAVFGEERAAIATEALAAAARSGWSTAHAAAVLDVLVAGRISEAKRHRIELVWSQPKDEPSRDTDAAIEDLAGHAESELLLSTMSIGHFGGPNPALEPIAARQVACAELRVRLFVNVPPASKNGERFADPRRRFVGLMRQYWPPGPPLPEIWFAPMALAGPDAGILHAKCVVADRKRAFVTSANLTESAQWRNIEAGALITDEAFASSLVDHFEQLISGGLVERLV
jgi:hypothetical protein